jgi:uncharacterized membrane protein
MNNRFARSAQTRSYSRYDTLMRWSPYLLGGGLIAYGLSRRSVRGSLVAAAGGAVALQGARINATTVSQQRFARASVIVDAPAAEVYRFWRDLENLPRFMHHLHSVSQFDRRRSKWIAYGPASSLVEWTAEIVAERENEIIAWRSLEGSQVHVDGSVEFRPATGNRGTVVDATILYRPLGGRAGDIAAKFFGKDPAFLIEQDLRRFKALIETGEIPTTVGQSHGPRSAIASIARLIDPDRPIRGGWGAGKITEMAEAKRRVS